MQTLLKGARVYTGSRFEPADVLIEDGRIVSVSDGHSSSRALEVDEVDKANDVCVYDLSGKYIFPGFVDVHVHFREPGFSHKETIKTGSEAAAAGGYTDVCTMPNLDPVPDSSEHLAIEEKAIANAGLINVYPYGSITVAEQGSALSQMEEIAGRVIAFSDDGKGIPDTELIREAMLRSKELGKLIAEHCEDMTCIGGSRIHAGRVANMLGIKGITSQSEWKMIERDVRIAEETGCAYHVCHISTAESVDIIRKAKARGVNVTCETAPHYLTMCEEDILVKLENGESPVNLGRYKMNPPLRSRSDMEALLEGLADGTIDMIATDHAPHAEEEKARGLMAGLMGVVGLECAFPVLYTRLVKNDVISLEKLVDLMTFAPARRFGIECGIEAGACAKLCVYDLDEKYVIDPLKFRSKGRFTPFDGWEVYGKCIMTICKDMVFHADDRN
ncbi:MAG: dihydroorotase [Lachnospiraceae bacterium]|nr:dihydroorotase [Lachnospiraceae bacterium]